MRSRVKLEGGFRTEAEKNAGKMIADIFDGNAESTEVKLDSFTKYVKRPKITRFLAIYELFKKILPVKGSIVECGVFRGFGLMSWAHLSAILEPVNLTRRIYGFDTFRGFSSVKKEDRNKYAGVKKGGLSSDSLTELNELVKAYDASRFLGHINKIQLIKGDAERTIPEFIKQNKHLVVSLLFLDFDLFKPTKAAIECFYPRMPEGSIIAFDELDNPIWPGETQALLKTIGINKLKIERIEFDPYIGFAVVGNKK